MWHWKVIYWSLKSQTLTPCDSSASFLVNLSFPILEFDDLFEEKLTRLEFLRVMGCEWNSTIQTSLAFVDVLSLCDFLFIFLVDGTTGLTVFSVIELVGNGCLGIWEKEVCKNFKAPSFSNWNNMSCSSVTTSESANVSSNATRFSKSNLYCDILFACKLVRNVNLSSRNKFLTFWKIKW